MKCPYCGFVESKVIDSRPTDENERIRRRRECIQWRQAVHHIRSDRGRPDHRRQKRLLARSVRPRQADARLLRACEKRPVSAEQIDQIVDRIEAQLQNSLEREIPSATIGELAMNELRKVDEVAYVRGLRRCTASSATSTPLWTS